MIEIFVELLLSLNKIFFNNLGLTIIVIGAASRLIFHPLIVSNLRYTKAARELKPKLDAVKKKYGNDMKRVAEEQSKVFKGAGVTPAAGAVGCFSLLIQLAVFFILFRALLRLLDSDVNTSFLIWDLAKPHVYNLAGLPLPIPGVLVAATAVLSLFQSKMVSFSTGEDKEKKKDDKPGLADMFAFQNQLVYLFPIIILISGIRFPSGLVVYWLVITVFGIIQQYQALGLGGLEPWVQKIRAKK